MLDVGAVAHSHVVNDALSEHASVDFSALCLSESAGFMSLDEVYTAWRVLTLEETWTGEVVR